jgi:hypothetical protein
MQMTNEERQAYELFDKRKRACERNSKDIETEIYTLIREEYTNKDAIVQQTQFLRDIYYYGVEPSRQAREYAQSLSTRSLQSWVQFKRLYAMIRQYDDGQEIFDAYFGKEGLKITSLDQDGEKTELSDLIEIIRNIDAYQIDLNQVDYIIKLYDDDTRRIGVFMEAEKVDEIIAKRNKTTHYLDHSGLGDFV